MFETKQGIIKPIVYVGILRDNRLLLVDYKQAPNPAKSGWWIPAPGLEFGEDPEEKAAAIAADFGFTKTDIKLKDVESFTTPGGWHLIYHFVGQVVGEPKANENIQAFKWVTAEELEAMNNIAHGKWEIEVGKSYLKK
jgi:ADP-ribose pyrophosphatase YjhB (NUDIX family)